MGGGRNFLGLENFFLAFWLCMIFSVGNSLCTTRKFFKRTWMVESICSPIFFLPLHDHFLAVFAVQEFIFWKVAAHPPTPSQENNGTFLNRQPMWRNFYLLFMKYKHYIILIK